MPVEAIDVIDSAVKIGLGAVIASITSYFTLQRTQRHDFDKEHFKRMQEALEKIAGDVEDLSNAQLRILTNSGDLIKNFNSGSRDQCVGELTKSLEQLHEFGAKMHGIEARLLMMNLPDVVEAVRDFKECLMQFVAAATSGKPPSVAAINEKSLSFQAARTRFYNTACRYYGLPPSRKRSWFERLLGGVLIGSLVLGVAYIWKQLVQ